MAGLEEMKRSSVRDAARTHQLYLFDSAALPSGQHPYSNSFALYDLAPKYAYGTPDENGGRVVRRRLHGAYLPIFERQFEYNGVAYQVEVRPARIKRDGEEVECYPGEREQVVEEALRRLAIEKRRSQMIDAEVGFRFSLYELAKELQRIRHTLSLAEIKEAIEICHLSNVSIGVIGERKKLVSASIFPTRAINEQTDDGETVTFVTFNPLVTKAINALDFRLYDYDGEMGLGSSLARWIHKRMVHTCGCTDVAYPISATTILRDSGIGVDDSEATTKRTRDRWRTVRRAIGELKDRGIITDFRERKQTAKFGKVIEVDYVLTPSHAFLEHLARANSARRQIKRKAEDLGLKVLDGGKTVAAPRARP